MENRRGILSILKNIYNKRAKEEEISEYFLENGSLLLEELIATSDGRYGIPIRNFSIDDLLRVTNNFDEHNQFRKDSRYILYKGVLEGREIVVKKFQNEFTSKAIRDIAIMAQMSIHKNVLKLIGCCLEDEAIAVAFEFAGERLLSDFVYKREAGSNSKSLSWKCRLRAANEIANVLTYLHTALPRPVVHRNVNPYIFIIDQHGIAKLSDFSSSITIPFGETRVEDLPTGLLGFLDPEYMQSSFVTAKSDVYSFGVLLLVLLTGKYTWEYQNQGVHMEEDGNLMSEVKCYVKNDRLNKIVDSRIVMEAGGGGGTFAQEQQLQAFAVLALRCTQWKGDDRPEMIEVAKELRRIERSIPCLTTSSNENQSNAEQ